MTTRTGLALGLVAWLAAGCTDRAVEVTATGRILGRLQTARGAGLAGTVRLSGAVEAAVLSRDSGEFVFEQVPAGTYLVAATAPDTLEGVATAPVAVDGLTDATIALTLTGVGTVTGTVLLDSAEPPAGTRIVLGGATATTLSGLDGRFALGGLDEGPHTLFAVREGWEPAPLGTAMIARGQTAMLATVTLMKTTTLTTSLSGTATLPGATDHSGIDVTVPGTAAKTTTATDGSYTLDGVPVGIVSVEFRRGGYTASAAPVLASSATPPIVLARQPYPLQAIDLTYGERLPIGGGSPVYWTQGATRAIWWAPGIAGTADGLVAFDRATGTQARLANAVWFALHPDGQRVLAQRFTALPSTTKELVSWDPASGAVVVIAPDVEAATLLPKRHEVLIVGPAPRFVSLEGTNERPVGEGPITLVTELADDESSLILGSAGTTPARWIDVATGAVLHTASNESILLSKSGKGLFLSTLSSFVYRARGATSDLVLGAHYSTPIVSPDGRWAVITWGDAHLWDLETGTDVRTFAITGGAAAFTADSQSLLVTTPNATSTTDLTIYPLPGAVPGPPITLDRVVAPEQFMWNGREALYGVPNPDGTNRLRRIDLDSALQTTVLPTYARLPSWSYGRLHYTTTFEATSHRVLDLATGLDLPVTYPGSPWIFDATGEHWLALDRERGSVTAWDLAGHSVVLAESESIRKVVPAAFFVDGDTVIVNRYQSSSEITAYPRLQVAEGIFVSELTGGQP